MRERLIIGPLLLLALLGLLWAEERFGGAGVPRGSVVAAVLVLIAWLGAGEFGTMVRAKGVPAGNLHLRACALAGLAGAVVNPAALSPAVAATVTPLCAAAVVLGSMIAYARSKSPPGVIVFAAVSLLAFVYLGVMLGFALAIRREHSAWVLLWVLLTAKACDIGAFFTGKAIGRHKLIPWLSPGKTWEGLVGGVVFAALVGAAGLLVLERLTGSRPMPGAAGLAFGAGAAVVGQAGDLMASFMKRDAGIKDSGRIIPGMGGLLDVIDSPLLVLPAACWWLRLAASAGLPPLTPGLH